MTKWSLDWCGKHGHCLGWGQRPADLLHWIWVKRSPQRICLEELNHDFIQLKSEWIKTNHQICYKKGWLEVYTLPLSAFNWYELLNSSFKIKFFIRLIKICRFACLTVCSYMYMNCKVYVCPPNFVLDHDWLAIPKVKTICRVIIHPFLQDMLFFSPANTLGFSFGNLQQLFVPLGEWPFWSAWLGGIQMRWS